ncbi:hypothetical protein NsoK4_08910 [Nitrosopumilus sp. K4]|uniref:hypothetical protein n=1 Tax=Nitrosopumilus sp. K4 TaxID=2795383 RepID=UPI001BA4EEE3|nr:hypothetical protein [Nitrosopumilus sp. K4]QUC64527.1 hypothetical protein NsoK4_08910 [Nitrosopumilus sp. K4]
MAKFKKKKSQPTPGPDDSKKEKPVEDREIPETEPVESKTPDIPPSEPPVNEVEKSEKDKKLNKLFWLRVGFAVIAGTAATFIFDGISDMEEKRWTSIGFMIIVFIVTIVIAKGMKIQLPTSDRKKIVTQGIGSYIFIYLFIWVLTNTLVHGNPAATGIPSPIP